MTQRYLLACMAMPIVLGHMLVEDCATVPVAAMEGFDKSKFVGGSWFAVEATNPQTSVVASVCSTLTFGDVAGSSNQLKLTEKKTASLFGTLKFGSPLGNSVATLTVDDASDPGDFTYEQDDTNIFFTILNWFGGDAKDFKILGTDYSTYAVTYMCSSNKASIKILNRSGTLSQSTIDGLKLDLLPPILRDSLKPVTVCFTDELSIQTTIDPEDVEPVTEGPEPSQGEGRLTSKRKGDPKVTNVE